MTATKSSMYVPVILVLLLHALDSMCIPDFNQFFSLVENSSIDRAFMSGNMLVQQDGNENNIDVPFNPLTMRNN